MFNIILYHLLVHGAKMVSGPDGNYEIENKSTVTYILLKSFLVFSVNCFVFISGYYRIKFKVESSINLLLQATFYGVIITFCFSLLSQQYLGVRYYIEAILSIFTGTWWFITAYFALYLLSPLLNTAIDSFTKKQSLFVLISLTLINCISGFLFYADPMGVNQGFSLVSFVHIYISAQFIRRYLSLDTLIKWSPFIYTLSCSLLFLLALLSIGELNERGIERVYAYNNPLVLVAAVSFFFLFQNFSFKSKRINRISPYVLGVYLFHDHPFMRKHLIEEFYSLSQQGSMVQHFLLLTGFAILVFIMGYLVDRLREYLLTPLVRYLIRRFDLLRIEGIFSIKASEKI